MKVFNEIQQLDSNIPRGVALGNFDGLHVGHQELIRTLVNKSNQLNLQACVYTFKNHTISLLSKHEMPPQITDQRMKLELFEKYKIDTLILDDFNETIMNLTPDEFVKYILVDLLNCKVAVIGFDYRFGLKAKGDAVKLVELGKKYGIYVSVIDPVTLEGEKVSSTSVRRYIAEGNMEKANEFLGRNFAIYSKVVHGMGRGRNLGYPTANIYVDPQQLIPKEGVYATLVKVDGGTYMGATCVGTNPTFAGSVITIETFVLDYEGPSLYDESIEVQFVKKLRDNIKFNEIDELIHQINIDVEISKKYLQPYLDMLK